MTSVSNSQNMTQFEKIAFARWMLEEPVYGRRPDRTLTSPTKLVFIYRIPRNRLRTQLRAQRTFVQSLKYAFYIQGGS